MALSTYDSICTREGESGMSCMQAFKWWRGCCCPHQHQELITTDLNSLGIEKWFPAFFDISNSYEKVAYSSNPYEKNNTHITQWDWLVYILSINFYATRMFRWTSEDVSPNPWGSIEPRLETTILESPSSHPTDVYYMWSSSRSWWPLCSEIKAALHKIPQAAFWAQLVYRLKMMSALW